MRQGAFVLAVGIRREEADFRHAKTVEQDAVFPCRLRAQRERAQQEQAGDSFHIFPSGRSSEYTLNSRTAVIVR
jgi:hypothetical protein